MQLWSGKACLRQNARKRGASHVYVYYNPLVTMSKAAGHCIHWHWCGGTWNPCVAMGIRKCMCAYAYVCGRVQGANRAAYALLLCTSATTLASPPPPAPAPTPQTHTPCFPPPPARAMWPCLRKAHLVHSAHHHCVQHLALVRPAHDAAIGDREGGQARLVLPDLALQRHRRKRTATSRVPGADATRPPSRHGRHPRRRPAPGRFGRC